MTASKSRSHDEQHSSRPHGPEAAGYLGLVSRADLLHLDAHPQRVGEVAHEIAKVDTVFSDEIKDRLAPVECVIDVDQLHRHPALVDALDAQPPRARLPPEVFFLGAEVMVIHEPNDRLEDR